MAASPGKFKHCVRFSAFSSWYAMILKVVSLWRQAAAEISDYPSDSDGDPDTSRLDSPAQEPAEQRQRSVSEWVRSAQALLQTPPKQTDKPSKTPEDSGKKKRKFVRCGRWRTARLWVLPQAWGLKHEMFLVVVGGKMQPEWPLGETTKRYFCCTEPRVCSRTYLNKREDQRAMIPNKCT